MILRKWIPVCARDRAKTRREQSSGRGARLPCSEASASWSLSTRRRTRYARCEFCRFRSRAAPMILIAFLQAQNCTNHASSWRHPLSRTDSWSPDYYRHIGRVLEHGKFDLGFFDDRLSMPDMYGRNHDHAVRYGIRCVKMDAVT